MRETVKPFSVVAGGKSGFENPQKIFFISTKEPFPGLSLSLKQAPRTCPENWQLLLFMCESAATKHSQPQLQYVRMLLQYAETNEHGRHGLRVDNSFLPNIGNMTDLVRNGLAARDLKKPRPASALGAVSSAKNDDFQWRSICHTIVPELLHGAHTKKMLTAKEGLPSIADQVLTTSLASITGLPAAGLGPLKSNSSLSRGVKTTATHTEQSCALETQAAREVDSIATPVTSAPSLKSKAVLVAASKAVGMITAVRSKMMENIVAGYTNDDKLLKSEAKIEELQAQVKSLNILLAAKETSCANAAALSSVDCSRHASSSASDQPSASNNGEVHKALIMRIEQLECSRDELKKQLVAFQDFAPVYREILAILGPTEGRKTAAHIVRNIEHLFDSQRVSGERILELQEKLGTSERDFKTMMRQKQAEVAGKESDLAALKNQLEQQKGLLFQIGRQKDEAIERRVELESTMLQLKIALKLLAESWGCDTSLVAEAEGLVALLSQTMIGKSSAQDSLQTVQGVINTSWLEFLHARYPGAKLPGDAISGIRMMYDSLKALNQQNEQLAKYLKEAKRQVSEKQDDLEKWKRARVSVMPLGPLILLRIQCCQFTM